MASQWHLLYISHCKTNQPWRKLECSEHAHTCSLLLVSVSFFFYLPPWLVSLPMRNIWQHPSVAPVRNDTYPYVKATWMLVKICFSSEHEVIWPCRVCMTFHFSFFCPFFRGNYLFAGTRDGVLRVHKVAPQPGESTLSLDKYWALSLHDSHSGRITNIKTSYNGRFLLTTGADGNFFVYSFNAPDIQEVEGAAGAMQVSLPSTPSLVRLLTAEKHFGCFWDL